MAYLDAPVRIDILRGDTDRLLQALRHRALDAVVVEFRTVTPSVDLRIEPLVEMRGAFMCRRGHPLARKRGPLISRACWPIRWPRPRSGAMSCARWWIPMAPMLIPISA
jgi:DNA-binding transcriptional LysR family regulator